MKKEIEEAMENLKNCMLKEHDLNIKEEVVKKDKIKAHNETRLAQDLVRSLKI